MKRITRDERLRILGRNLIFGAINGLQPVLYIVHTTSVRPAGNIGNLVKTGFTIIRSPSYHVGSDFEAIGFVVTVPGIKHYAVRTALRIIGTRIHGGNVLSKNYIRNRIFTVVVCFSAYFDIGVVSVKIEYNLITVHIIEYFDNSGTVRCDYLCFSVRE